MYRKLVICLVLLIPTLQARHPFRIVKEALPTVIAQWNDGSDATVIANRYLRYYPIFAFNTQQFMPYLLPQAAVSYGTGQSVTGALLSEKIELVLTQLPHRKHKRKKHKRLNDFEILQDKDFNYRQRCGLIVLAFKDYPFVVKLFMAKPETLLDYRATGIEPIFFFYMGGGANRHLTGFTRLKNREYIIEKISKLERWKNHITIPRKWFWLPKDQRSIVLTGYNIGGLEQVTTTIPGTYAIIADKIDFTNQTDILSTEKKQRMFMQLCNDLELNIDPHAKNFSLLEDKIKKKFTITLVDTEHFPTMVGDFSKKRFKNHTEWYMFLAGKCLVDIYLQSKRDLTDKGKRSVAKFCPLSVRPSLPGEALREAWEHVEGLGVTPPHSI